MLLSLATLFTSACVTSADPVGDDSVVIGDDGSTGSNAGGHPVRGNLPELGERDATPPVRLSVDNEVYAQSSTLVVTYDGLPGNASDWVGLYHVGASDEQVSSWLYTEGTSSGHVSFHVNFAAGTYVARSFVMDSYERVAESAPFVVTAPPVTVAIDRNSYTDADSIVVDYAGFTDDVTNWLTVVPVGAPLDQYGEYLYTNGASMGRVTFSPLPAGEYEVRAFFNNSDNCQASAAFTVVAR